MVVLFAEILKDFSKRFISFYVWVLCLYVCIWTMCMSGAHRGKKNVLESLEMELKIIVSHKVSARSWTWVLYMSNKCFNYWSISLATYCSFCKTSIPISIVIRTIYISTNPFSSHQDLLLVVYAWCITTSNSSYNTEP